MLEEYLLIGEAWGRAFIHGRGGVDGEQQTQGSGSKHLAVQRQLKTLHSKATASFALSTNLWEIIAMRGLKCTSFLYFQQIHKPEPYTVRTRVWSELPKNCAAVWARIACARTASEVFKLCTLNIFACYWQISNDSLEDARDKENMPSFREE